MTQPQAPCLPLSAIVLTKNEAQNITRCLESLQFVPEIIVLDSGSSDETVSLAQTFPNVRVVQQAWQGFAETKKQAIGYATHPWILWVDADEEVSLALAQEITRCLHLPPGPDIAGFEMARKTFFLGTWVQHSGWYPGWIIRLFHKEQAQINDRILHEGVEPLQGFRIARLSHPLLHYSYTSLYQYFDKMNKYGLAGAQELQRKQKKRPSLLQLFLQPCWTFFRFYVLKLGFLDGKVGLIVCMGAAFSNFIKYTNYEYLKKEDHEAHPH